MAVTFGAGFETGLPALVATCFDWLSMRLGDRGISPATCFDELSMRWGVSLSA